jgi:hypothetical protein
MKDFNIPIKQNGELFVKSAKIYHRFSGKFYDIHFK